jgi:hypothetical protein
MQGKIRLREVPKATHTTAIRYAPSFMEGYDTLQSASYPYTPHTVAEFLGWLKPDGRAQDKVYSALTALQFIEEGILNRR